MASKLLHLLLLLLLLSAAAAAATTNSTDFIRLRCSTTLHPSLCFHSLSRYYSNSSSSSTNHTITSVRLAQLASNLTLVRLRSLSSLLSSSSSLNSSSSSYSAALSDCRECLRDAVDLVAQTVAEIGRIERAGGLEIGWRVSNALTWMSAALTNEDTCADSLDEAWRRGGVGNNGPGRAVRRGDPCWRIHRAMEFTSNALALVNSLVN